MPVSEGTAGVRGTAVGTPLGGRGDASGHTADEAIATVAAARTAQPAWRDAPLAERLDVLRRFRRILARRRLEAAEAIRLDTGKPLHEALLAEVGVALEFARYYVRESPALLGARWRTGSSLPVWRKRVRVTHEPLGVLGVIAPWNYPLMLPAGVVLPALAAGNAVVLKPSELAPRAARLLADMLAEAGLPRGLLGIVEGDGAAGAALVAADVDKVFFTGSVETGRKVARACAERLIPCSLELGGSDPAVVLADADVALAARGIAWGRFANAGQTCVAAKRVFVEDAAYETFVTALSREVEALRVGRDAGADLGPLVSERQASLVRGQLEDALSRGARVAARASVPAEAGAFVAPTVLIDVPPDARVLHEETFGPVLPVVRVRDADEAVALANAGAFGLSASVWGRDRRRMLGVARRLEAGSVSLNDALVVAGMSEVPHGGVKASGSGRSHGAAGLMECVRTKTYVDERVPGAPQLWWFGDPARRLRLFDAVVALLHEPGARAKARALRALARLWLS